MKLSELYWHRITPLHFLLWPLSVLYRFFLKLKKLCYWLDILPSVKLAVPVIIIDSASIEDSGKTPLLLWLVDCLRMQGYSPGIITRGNLDNPGSPVCITPPDNRLAIDSQLFLLAQRCGAPCPIWIGNDRIATVHALLQAHPTCDIVICTDGLQYYRLEHDLEIVVVNFSDHSIGNGMLLPAGPLRIDLDDLTTSSLIVINGEHNHRADTATWGKTYRMKLVNEVIYNAFNPETRQPISTLRNLRLHVVTDLYHSAWLFDVIQKAGLNAELHCHAENHHFIPADIHLPDADAILMPEENAVQCTAFATEKLWILPRSVWVSDEFRTAVIRTLEQKTNLHRALL